MSRGLRIAPDPAKDFLVRRGRFIVEGELLLTDHEWAGGITPDDALLSARRREIGCGVAQGPAMPMPEQPLAAPPSPDPKQLIELRAAAPIRAKVDQADMADTPLCGTGSLL